jgi:hypothetical protein
VLEGTKEEEIVREEAWAQTVFPRGGRRAGGRAGGRVTLVGDAAHGVRGRREGGQEGGREGGRKGRDV